MRAASEAKFLVILLRSSNVTISVKGEDSEKKTVSATRTFRFKVNESQDHGVYLP